MTLYSLASKNIKKSIRQYIIYLNSMVVSISIYFTFVSLEYNEQLLRSTVTLGKMASAFHVASIVLMLFSAIFIWYSNSFFTRKRKKEIGLYSLFGMSKRKVGQLLFYENLILGMAALILGISIGLLFSKLFMMIIFKIMDFSLEVTFTLSSRALLQTIVFFLLIIVITSVHGYRLIYRFSLAELFKAERKGESRGKAPAITSFLAITFIGSGYFFILNPGDLSLIEPTGIRTLTSVILLIIGSYLFMHSVSNYVLIIVKKITSVYYKGKNLLSVSHLKYRMQGNVLVLTVISLLSSVTIVACVLTYSFYYHIDSISKKENPYSYIFNLMDDKDNDKLQAMIEKDSLRSIIYSQKVEYLPIQTDVSILERVPDFFQIVLFSEDSFHKLMKKRGVKEEVHLGMNEAITFYDGNLDQTNDPYSGKTLSLPNIQTVKITDYKGYSLLNQGERLFPLVISDSLFNDLKKDLKSENLYIYKLENEKELKALNNKINRFSEPYKYVDKTPSPIYSSFYEKYHYSLETYGLLIFISGFLGLVFLLATGSIIYFKQLMEATSDKARYKILEKIGIPEKEVKRSITRQVGFTFFLPLVLAISHSAVFLTVLADYLPINIQVPFIICLGVYLCIYLIYYWLTSTSYFKIIKGN
ncbi:ABC transporter permease [Bacillus sp. 1P10SD]|uniref:ABC transporter permease n=1 Tax=Bacillus sp. 1P10SD TaxID=3132265 RepID=UPI0039A71F30